MSIAEIILDGGIGVFIILSLIQITPIKINPWSAFVKFINKDITKQLEEIKKQEDIIQKNLNDHIEADEERNMNYSRNRILQFNTEIKRHLLHTEEDFNQILADIDVYEKYCLSHPNYPNQRAIHAITNIKRVYDDCLHNNNFLV